MVLTAQNCQCIFQRNRLEQISFNFLSEVLPCGTAWARHGVSGSPTYCFFSVRNHGMLREWNMSSDMPGGRQTNCLSVEDKGLQPGGPCCASMALCGVLGRSCAWASAACASEHALTERTQSWQCDCAPWSAAPWFISCVRRLCGPVLIIIFTCCMESSCCLWFKGWTSLTSHWIVHWVLLVFIQNLLWLVNVLPCSFKSKYHFP